MDVLAAGITALAGVAIGVLSGMLGIGGGAMMIPIFRLGFQLDAIAATATSLFAIIFISCSGAVTHVRNKTAIVPIGLAAGIGGGIMSPVGVQLAAVSPSWCLMLAAAVIITYSSCTMVKKALAMPGKKTTSASNGKSGKGAGASKENAEGQAGPFSQAEQASRASRDAAFGGVSVDRSTVLKAACIGGVAGVCSGYVGVGGGFIMVPMFLSLLNVPMRFASGSSLLAIIIIAVPGTVAQLLLGNVNVLVGFAIVVGAIPGAILGANFAKRIPEKQLRIFFAVILIVSAVLLVVNEFL